MSPATKNGTPCLRDHLMRFPTLHFNHLILDLPRGTKEVNQAILLPTDGLPPFVNESMQNSIYRRQIEHKGIPFESRRMECVQPACSLPLSLFTLLCSFTAACGFQSQLALQSRQGYQVKKRMWHASHVQTPNRPPQMQNMSTRVT